MSNDFAMVRRQSDLSRTRATCVSCGLPSRVSAATGRLQVQTVLRGARSTGTRSYDDFSDWVKLGGPTYRGALPGPGVARPSHGAGEYLLRAARMAIAVRSGRRPSTDPRPA